MVEGLGPLWRGAEAAEVACGVHENGRGTGTCALEGDGCAIAGGDSADFVLFIDVAFLWSGGAREVLARGGRPVAAKARYVG